MPKKIVGMDWFVCNGYEVCRNKGSKGYCHCQCCGYCDQLLAVIIIVVIDVVTAVLAVIAIVTIVAV